MNRTSSDNRPLRKRQFSHLLVGLTLTLAGTGLSGCGDDNGTPPNGTLLFGEAGEITVALRHPLIIDEREGELQQILTYGSTGTWVLREVISYRGLVGDESFRENEGDPITFHSGYKDLVTRLNTPGSGLELFSVEPMEDLECEPGETQVTVTIWDEWRGEDRSWKRCAGGTLAGLATAEAGPDLEAVRVIQTAILVRNHTHKDGFTSAYVGSIPFGTLDRSEESGAGYQEPRVFFSVPAGNPKTPTGWLAFWLDHNGTSAASIPNVDWENEFAVVAAVGLREEAGDSVEVRRVLQTGSAILIETFERNPGDFCSPAARDHYPVHVIVAPRFLLPVDFTETKQERVDCGG